MQLFQGTGYTSPYGATDVCGIQHTLPLVGPQYASQCFWKQYSGNPDPNHYAAGTYFTAGGEGALSSDSIIVDRCRLIVASVNWTDGLTAAGQPIDNNFDIRKDTATLLVPRYGPEWQAGMPGARGSETCYIRDTRPRAEVVFTADPPVVSQNLEVVVWSEGDIDLTPAGTAAHNVVLQFDQQGRATHTFTAYQQTVGGTLDFKDFTLTWKGAADGGQVPQQVVQPIYVLYGPPVDHYNKTAPDHEPLLFHLRMLLGPKVGPRGEWAKGATSLNKLDLPRRVQLGVQGDGIFNVRRQDWGNPWDVVTPGRGNVCESFAELFKEALVLVGVPAAKLDRKSVVSAVVARPSWLGHSHQQMLIKAFMETPGPNASIWINEGVCGAQTDDVGWQYYDVAGSDEIGTGGWGAPGDPAGNNLWYEPPVGQHGPVMYAIVEDTYGTWVPPTEVPYAPFPVVGRPWVAQVEVTGLVHAGTNLTVTYRTEGAKDNGQKVLVTLLRKVARQWDTVATHVEPIAQRWDNEQSHTFGLLLSGTYKVEVAIQTAGGQTPFGTWVIESVPLVVP